MDAYLPRLIGVAKANLPTPTQTSLLVRTKEMIVISALIQKDYNFLIVMEVMAFQQIQFMQVPNAILL